MILLDVVQDILLDVVLVVVRLHVVARDVRKLDDLAVSVTQLDKLVLSDGVVVVVAELGLDNGGHNDVTPASIIIFDSTVTM